MARTREEILKEIKLEDKCRDFRWIKDRYDNGKLNILGYVATESILESLRILIRCTEEVYSGNWDLDIEVTSGTTDPSIKIKGLIIYFDTMNITNSRSRDGMHTVTDLFVKVILSVHNGRLIVDGLDGMRTKVTYAEYISNYYHSHLSQGAMGIETRNNVAYWGSFCRGAGHINDFIADINSDGITEANAIPLLVQITGLLSWESLEGVPHKYFRDIAVRPQSGSVSSPSIADTAQLKNLVLSYHREEDKIPVVDFKYESGQYKIVDNERFTEFLTNTVPFTNDQKKRFICMQNTEGTYYRWGSVPGYRPVPDTENLRKFIFQGREISMQIGAPPTTEEESQIQYFLHPNLRRDIKQELEYDSNIKKIRESTINRYSD